MESGILESWNPGILESWNLGILESYHITAEYVIIKILLLYSGPPRGGGRGGGQIAPGPEVLGAPEFFLLGPSLLCVLNISAQRTRYLLFGGKYRNLA
jgi:hypothetical protein